MNVIGISNNIRYDIIALWLWLWLLLRWHTYRGIFSPTKRRKLLLEWIVLWPGTFSNEGQDHNILNRDPFHIVHLMDFQLRLMTNSKQYPRLLIWFDSNNPFCLFMTELISDQWSNERRINKSDATSANEVRIHYVLLKNTNKHRNFQSKYYYQNIRIFERIAQKGLIPNLN